MEREQELEWEEAQSTEINVDLVSAAKRQLKFLAAVDRNRWLYEGPGLDRAIYRQELDLITALWNFLCSSLLIVTVDKQEKLFIVATISSIASSCEAFALSSDRNNSCLSIIRYNAYWLPLLAKHSETQLLEGPLVVPLDCEWVWHCHRLNPGRYKQDCEEFYGRILDNQNVVSSLEGSSTKATEEIWGTLFPGEPYELDMETVLQDNVCGHRVLGEKHTKYDLVSAAQRQSPFFYQVSRTHMNDNRYIQGAVARYKGFLHLIKRNKEKGIKSFSVPTYDIDLIWHTHQLHPASYCKDLLKIMGKILDHDDTDSDRTKGQKLDVGFSGTTKTFEEMYGSRYWRAGAMYRGSAPSPVRPTPYSGIVTKEVPTSNENQKLILPTMKVLEVMMEFVSVRNLPEGHKGSLFVSFSKTQPDEIFNAKRSLTIFSESGEKKVATFQCQPTGSLLFELVSFSPSSLPVPKSSKTIGTTSISLEDFMSPDSDLIVEKWLDLVPSSNIMASNPIGLRVAISVTIPIPAPYVLQMIHSRPFSKSSCLFPLPMRVQFAKSWTSVTDEAGRLVLSLQMRDLRKSKGKKECRRRVVVGITESGETCTLAESVDSEWSMVNSPWSLKLPNINNDDGHILELAGPQTVRLFPGGRLDYESRRCEKHKSERQLENHLVTAVEFSAEDPYGRAVALLDLKYGTVKVKENWFLLPGVVLAFIFGNIWRKGGYNSLILGSKSLKQKELPKEEVGCPAAGSETNLAPVQKEPDVKAESAKENALIPANGAPSAGGCGGGCGSSCGNGIRTTAESGGCGGCGGSGCGNMAKCGGCGGSGGCGGGCGSGGRGNMARCGGCGGSGGCGKMAKCGGCGGGCGSKLANANSDGDGCINGHPNEIVVA
ncbi:UNVERIFIED_CONTAM: Glycine-rich domain-containing protein 1 [Sesamum calycinum]|uniref:Glycine-rich domain-containing protein 1 n=1 Tax=Sesamum calycinum TaxID=2727403 RepID=A0AAW2MLN2_9LAMI